MESEIQETHRHFLALQNLILEKENHECLIPVVWNVFVKSLNGLRKEYWVDDKLVLWLKEWSTVFLVIQPIRCVLKKQLMLFVPWSEKKRDESAFFTSSSSIEEKIGSIFGILFLETLYLNQEKDDKMRMELCDELVQWSEWILDIHEVDESLVIQTCLCFPLILEAIRNETTIENEKWIRIHSMIIPKQVLFLVMMVLTVHSRDTVGILWRMQWIPIESFIEPSVQSMVSILSILCQLNLSVHEESVCEEKDAVRLSNEWMKKVEENMNDCFESQFLRVLIVLSNTCLNRMEEMYHTSHICLIENLNRMNDVGCDSITEDWIHFYQFAYHSQSKPLVLSFTFSSTLSQNPVDHSILFLSIPHSLIILLLQLIQIHFHSPILSFDTFSSFIHSLIRLLREAMDSERTDLQPNSANAFILFNVLLSKLILHFFLINPDCSTTNESLLVSAELLAPPESFPPSVLFPFVIPDFLRSLSIPNKVKITALRCYPYLASFFPWAVCFHPELTHPRQWLDWILGYSDVQSHDRLEDPESIQFWFICWKQEVKSGRFENTKLVDLSTKRLCEQENTPLFIWFLLSHLKDFSEDVHKVALQFLSSLFASSHFGLNCLFPVDCDHCCELAGGVVLFLCSVSDTVFLSVFHQYDFLRRFVMNVKCMMNMCPNPSSHRYCRCEECCKDLEKGNDMGLIRQSVYQLREKLVQRIRLLMQEKTWKNHPIIMDLKSLFPELFVVWFITNTSIIVLFQFLVKNSLKIIDRILLDYQYSNHTHLTILTITEHLLWS